MPRITSPDNPRLKQAIRLLASSRDRRKAGLCVLEGAHLVNAYIERHGMPETVIVLDGGGSKVRNCARCVRHSRIALCSRSPHLHGQSSRNCLPMSRCSLSCRRRTTGWSASRDFCLLLEDLQDPGNVGSILRTAAAAGVAQVFMSRHCAFAWSPKVLRAGQGGHFHLEIFEDVDLVAWTRNYHGTTVADGRQQAASRCSRPTSPAACDRHRQRRRRLVGALRAAATSPGHDPHARQLRVAQRRGRRRGVPVRVRAPAVGVSC